MNKIFRYITLGLVAPFVIIPYVLGFPFGFFFSHAEKGYHHGSKTRMHWIEQYRLWLTRR